MAKKSKTARRALPPEAQKAAKVGKLYEMFEALDIDRESFGFRATAPYSDPDSGNVPTHFQTEDIT